MGATASEAFGRLLTASLQAYAMGQAKQPKAQRGRVFVFVDEFHHYVSESMESILTDARKYGLSLFVANQSLAQLRPKMRELLVGNAFVKALGPSDATTQNAMASVMGAKPEVVKSLPNYRFLLKAGRGEARLFSVPKALLKRRVPKPSQERDDAQLARYYSSEKAET